MGDEATEGRGGATEAKAEVKVEQQGVEQLRPGVGGGNERLLITPILSIV
jgi:hypothetical protein